MLRLLLPLAPRNLGLLRSPSTPLTLIIILFASSSIHHYNIGMPEDPNSVPLPDGPNHLYGFETGQYLVLPTWLRPKASHPGVKCSYHPHPNSKPTSPHSLPASHYLCTGVPFPSL